ncbi:alpha/beta hydrolase [Clostridium felsineum]|uniref:alpha/beta hydrolase n=1 Tax=Clostridium felsineum TaxID=36839 RepID=UPI00098C1445|nr:alpha/beta hydrolase [Clostridium felsineum]URZ04648.1 Acetyl esterase [Clostridium felsineum]
MKKNTKKILIFSSIIVLIAFFIIIVFIKSTSKGLDTYISLKLNINSILKPNSIDNKSIKEVRKTLDTETTRWSKPSIPFSNIKNFTIVTNSNKVPVRIYTPGNASNIPIVIYSHSGSWAAGNLDTEDNVCRKLSRNTNAIVISVNYRLAPENPFPSGLTDVYDVLQWTYKNAKSINGDEKRIAVVGASSGGNLSAAASLMSRDKNGPPIVCEVLIYPSTNIFKLNSESWSHFSKNINIPIKDMEKYVSLYVPKKEDRKNSYASPLLAEDFTRLPDTLIITAQVDPLRDEGNAYGEKLKNAGVKIKLSQYTGVPHGFITMDKITKKADKALDEVALYLQKEFHK